jgi:uncharacterized protein
MNSETLEALVKGYMATPQPQYAFAWQGGEPTLMGLDFFQQVVELQKKYGAFGASVANHLQTNGIMISADLARHLSRYNFLVGVSLDGPAEVHDRFRQYANGRGSHEQVMNGIRLLQKNQVKVNILTLVSKANVSQGREVYRYLRGKGFDFHQYIPCVEFDDAGRLQPFAVTAEEWGGFLCQVFDEWIKCDVGRISIRYFDALFQGIITGKPNLCHLEQNCSQYFVVEHNGDVYPCDFFVDGRYKLGNLLDDSWEELQASSKYIDFGAMKRDWNPECGDCRFLAYCAGDCLKHRLTHGTGRPAQMSWLCQGYKQFLHHALPSLKSLAEEIQQKQTPSSIGGRMQARPKKVGRNELCPCGSGRKYKKCCGGPSQGKTDPHCGKGQTASRPALSGTVIGEKNVR